MVLYFSATGNTRFLATELAQKLGDECTDLLERIKKTISRRYAPKDRSLYVLPYTSAKCRDFSANT